MPYLNKEERKKRLLKWYEENKHRKMSIAYFEKSSCYSPENAALKRREYAKNWRHKNRDNISAYVKRKKIENDNAYLFLILEKEKEKEITKINKKRSIRREYKQKTEKQKQIFNLLGMNIPA